MLESRIAYTSCMIAAAFVAGAIIRSSQRSLELDTWQRIGILVGALVGATLGAKLPFVFQSVFFDSGDTLRLLSAWFADGKTVLWALVGGYVGVEFAKWTFYVRFSTGDTFVIGVAVAIAIGRVGCFLYGCCHGIATNQIWGVRFAIANDGGILLRHPTQLYESLFHLGFALLAWWATRGHGDEMISNRWLSVFSGHWMILYLIAYAVFRFLTEFLRPEPVMMVGLTFYQWSSILIFTGFTILFWRRQIGSSQSSES